MPLYLRVKRLRRDVPVECFEASRFNKLSRLDTEKKCASTFRYIGSQLDESNAINEGNLENLLKIDPKGSFKLLWNANSGKIFGKGVAGIPCAVSTFLIRPVYSSNRMRNKIFLTVFCPHLL